LFQAALQDFKLAEVVAGIRLFVLVRRRERGVEPLAVQRAASFL